MAAPTCRAGVLLGGALRYLQPAAPGISMLAEAGGWLSPSGSYSLTRSYDGGSGTGTTSGTQSYIFGRAGPVSDLADGDEVAVTGEIGRQELDTDAYDEQLSGNPFNAAVSAGSDSMTVAKLRGQWTHKVSQDVDVTVWAALARSFGHSTTVSTTIAGFGALSPATSDATWVEAGGRIGYQVRRQGAGAGFCRRCVRRRLRHQPARRRRPQRLVLISGTSGGGRRLAASRRTC